MKPLFDYQRKALDEISGRRTTAIIAPTGSGKTRLVLEWARRKPGTKLIVCPPSAMYVWSEQVQNWLGESCLVLADLPRARKLASLKTLPQRWIVISYQSVQRLGNHMMVLDLPATTILDESHYIKNPQAKVTKVILKSLRFSTWRAIVTATPITNSLLDTWSQMYFLDGGKALGSSFWMFRQQYFKSDSMGWNWEPTRQGTAVIENALVNSGVCLSEKNIDLPNRTYSKRFVELPGKTMRVYKNLRDDFSLGGGLDSRFDTIWAAVRFSKMAQVCSGFFYQREPKPNVLRFPCSKYTELREILSQHNLLRTVVWCNFRQEIKLVVEMLTKEGISHVTFSGEHATSEKAKIVQAFNRDPAYRVFVGQVQAGAESISIQAPLVVYLSNTFSIKARVQSEGRVCRVDSTSRRVHYIDIVTRGTYEEELYNLVRQRKKVTRAVLMKRLYRAVFGNVRS